MSIQNPEKELCPVRLQTSSPVVLQHTMFSETENHMLCCKIICCIQQLFSQVGFSFQHICSNISADTCVMTLDLRAFCVWMFSKSLSSGWKRCGNKSVVTFPYTFTSYQCSQTWAQPLGRTVMRQGSQNKFQGSHKPYFPHRK